MSAVISILTALAVGLIGLLIDLYVLRLYPADPEGGTSTKFARWVERWDFSAQMLGGFSYWWLALASALGLFVELLMIRWVTSEINIFAYLKNFVLVACFFGFGLGCYLSRRRINLAAMLLPLIVLALICELPLAPLRGVIDSLPFTVGGISQINIFGMPSTLVWAIYTSPSNWHTLAALLTTLLIYVPIVALLVVAIFGMIALVFVPIGQMVGWYLENAANGIAGYTVNIVGSLAGIALFTLLCFISQPPAVWFLVAGGLLGWLLWALPRLRWTAMAAFLICVGLASIGPGGDARTYWSPYQKLTLRPVRQSGELIAYEVETNGTWYQRIIDLSPQFVAAHPALFGTAPAMQNPYNLPYLFFPHPASVLVLGAGTGNDAAAAVRNGAGQVTAVEIDPLILQLGRQLHFEQPYSSPRVNVVVDDARSYVQNSNERFDLVVYSLLDSHTTNSYYSNIRIDNYVYTVEAIQAAKRLLKPDGVMIVKFVAETPWIAGRLYRLLQAGFGQTPLYFEGWGPGYDVAWGRFFVAGSQRRIEQALADPGLAAYVAHHRNERVETAPLTTDDWPYFYQRAPGLPASVVHHFHSDCSNVPAFYSGNRHRTPRRSDGTSFFLAPDSCCWRRRSSAKWHCCSGPPGWSIRS